MKFFTSLILIGVAFGLAFIYVKPTYGTIMDLRQQISKHDEAISRAQKVGSLRDELVSRRQSFSTADVGRLETFLPDSVDGVRLVIDINGIASQYAPGIKNIRISSGGKDSGKSSEASLGAGYEPVTLSFGISLTYEQFLKFASDIERSLRLVNITSLTFSPSSDPASSLYDYSITLSAYMLK